MSIRVLVIDDELGRLAYKREEFLRHWSLFPPDQFARELEFTFITSQRTEADRLINDAALALAQVANNPDVWSLVLLDMQFDHGPLASGEPLLADPQFGLQIQAALEKEFPGLPIVHFTAQSQQDLARQDGVYLSKIDGTADDLRLLLVRRGRLTANQSAKLLQVPADTVVASASTIALYADVYQRRKALAPLLIRGETGTGKEHLARYLHRISSPSGAPWVALQVSAIPASLYESALFGHEKGAFTGADSSRAGAFTEAANGTLFLDEIGALTPELQAKLLRVLGERRFKRLGGSEEFPVRCAIVAATQDDLESSGFRRDLLARFSAVTIPPLRARPEELLITADHFLADAQQAHEKRGMSLSAEARAALKEVSFPDNARGLRRVLEHAVQSLSSNSVVGLVHLQLPVGAVARSAIAPVAQPPAVQRAAPESAVAFGKVVEGMRDTSVPEHSDELRGALSEFDAAVVRIRRDLAIACLKACRHPISGKPKVLPAMQLLTGGDRMTPMQAKRKLNELLGRSQNEPQGEAWLRALCEPGADRTQE